MFVVSLLIVLSSTDQGKETLALSVFVISFLIVSRLSRKFFSMYSSLTSCSALPSANVLTSMFVIANNVRLLSASPIPAKVP